MSSKAKKILGAVGVWFVIGAIVAIALVAHPPSASAHNGTIVADCDGLTASLTNFPQGTQTVTFSVDGQSIGTDTFEGPAGSASIPHDFTAGGSHSIGVSWTADGGGQASSTFDATGCVPTTTLPPPTTVPAPDPTVTGSADCVAVSFSLIGFPEGPNTATVTLDGVAGDVAFTGPDAAVNVRWTDDPWNVDTTKGVHQYIASADGVWSPLQEVGGDGCTDHDVCEDGSQPPCVDPDVVVVPPPPPVGPVEAQPVQTGGPGQLSGGWAALVAILCMLAALWLGATLAMHSEEAEQKLPPSERGRGYL